MTHAIAVVDDKIQSIKHCEMCQLFLITVHGGTCNLNCLTGVILQ